MRKRECGRRDSRLLVACAANSFRKVNVSFFYNRQLSRLIAALHQIVFHSFLLCEISTREGSKSKCARLLYKLFIACFHLQRCLLPAYNYNSAYFLLTSTTLLVACLQYLD